MARRRIDIYHGADPRELPAYPLFEAARYLYVNPTTLDSWVSGPRPIIHLPAGEQQLSFFNLVEAFVLDVLRRKRRFSLQQLRRDLTTLEQMFPDFAHPLAQADLLTWGRELYAEHGERLTNVSLPGQTAVRELLRDFLQRVEKDPTGGVVKLYPFTNVNRDPAAPKSIVIDPRVQFGRPVIAGTSIPTDVIASRFRAGDLIAKIAEDYDREPTEIEEAIRYETAAEAA